MIKFFRKIRQRLVTDPPEGIPEKTPTDRYSGRAGNKFSPPERRSRAGKYLFYASGEIVLVVIGILIALQINNWNEHQKEKTTEIYVLREVLSNLNEDGIILKDIIEQRQKAKSSVENMFTYLQTENINKDILEKDLVHFLTFERYFPINNAYEILKSKGLQLSNNKLTTKISRYYDFEQKKMNGSILDVENAILTILENRNGIARFIETLTLKENIDIPNYDDADFKNELYREIVPFKNNNIGTLNKLIMFYENNQSLSADIEKELTLLSK